MGLLLTQSTETGYALTRTTETGYVLTRTTEIGPLWPAIARMKNKRQCTVASSITVTNIAESVEIVDYTITRFHDNRDDYTRFYKSMIFGMNVIPAANLNCRIVRLYDQIPDFDYHA
jgi:hypothetical protein